MLHVQPLCYAAELFLIIWMKTSQFLSRLFPSIKAAASAFIRGKTALLNIQRSGSAA